MCVRALEPLERKCGRAAAHGDGGRRQRPSHQPERQAAAAAARRRRASAAAGPSLSPAGAPRGRAGGQVFQYCPKLRSVSLGGGRGRLPITGDIGVFAHCPGLRSVKIFKAAVVGDVGAAFGRCPELETLNINKSSVSGTATPGGAAGKAAGKGHQEGLSGRHFGEQRG